ncbi:flavin reductase [Pontixanthobacter gangjinensis]|uniref:Flavin reductase n=1 Tax=Pontixanthobacter gangjinensis TaxID=1028742 RepID=A0A6I4SIE0_9SPHN|nr:flavin reductase [Pontixanthobacter gangjinensis]MXO55353.1 flavin reductase [Pontixanthobacter gangjinensis]
MSDSAPTGQDFRKALGAFATGVTIATTKGTDGKPVGVTASSFNSVSVDPPLVLWSLAKNSFSHDAFSASGHFAVHVLAASQEDLSNRFARSGEDKFNGVEWEDGALGSPVFAEYAALFQCQTRHQYDGGDHVIFVGEVKSYEAHDVAPLLFHGGRYAERRPKTSEAAQPSVDLEHGRFSDDFLFYLISRAHYQTSQPVRQKLAELGLSMDEYLTLSLLGSEAPLTSDAIVLRLGHTGYAPSAATLNDMAQKDLIKARNDGFELSPAGREQFVETLALGKSFEADLADHFSEGELAETKRVLRRIIELTARDQAE